MSEKYGCHKSPSEEYEIFICSSEDTEKYYITFKDVNGSLNEVEISEQVYFEFLKSFRVMNNHRWRSWYHGTAELHENMIPATPVPNLEDIIIEREWIERIDKAIVSLPTKQRRRFRLYYELGLSFSEIARREGCTLMAAKKAVSKAAIRVRMEITKEKY